MPATIPLALALATWLSAPFPLEKQTITAAEARAHVGQDVRVCGKVVLVRKAVAAKVGATWQIYLDQVSPPLLALIANASTIDNPYFVSADSRFSGKDVCAEGKLFDHNGLVYIRLSAPGQIRIVKDKN
jgi:hypothetical protein